jgi:hypothetical protein
MKTTVAAITRELGVPYCWGISRGFYCPRDHRQQGTITPDGTIHLHDHVVTKTNLVTVLRMIAIAQDPTLNGDVPWRRVYRIDVAIRALAIRLRTRIPRETFANDRSFVRASCAGLSNDVPMRKQAFDWARR